jgi:hypothetical protein
MFFEHGRFMATIKINIPATIGTGVCVATTDGQKVHDVIANNLRAGNFVEISFAGVTSIITAFLNAAIGQLYGEFKEEEIGAKLSLTDTKPADVEKVTRVVTGAKLYFKDKKKFEATQRDVMGTAGDD